MRKRSDDPAARVDGRFGEVVPVWFALLAPPVAAITHLQAMFVLEHTACSTQAKLQLHIASLILVAIVIVAAVIARREWIRLGSDDPGQLPGPLGTRRLMALMGMIGSGISGLFILAQWFPTFILSTCVRT